MKNPLLTFFLGLFLSLQLPAQNAFSIQPIPSSGTGTAAEIEVLVNAFINNLTADTLHLSWERKVIELSPTCQTSVVDPYISWVSSVSKRNFFLLPNEMSSLGVYFLNNGIDCAGIVHLKVINMDNPSDSLSGVYLFNQASALHELPATKVKLYPNPVTSSFSLENDEAVAAIRVFSLDGKEVARFERNPGNTYTLGNQTAGHYILALEDKNGEVIQALDLKKQ